MLPRRGVLGAVVAALGLSGCGFQLKAPARVRPELAMVYVDAPDRYSDLYRALGDALRQSGVTLRSGGEPGGVVLELRKDETARRIMSVSVRNVPTEYEVYYNVTYRITVDGRESLAATDLAASRVISFDETAELEKEQEEAIVREGLARDLAERIVRRLAAL